MQPVKNDGGRNKKTYLKLINFYQTGLKKKKKNNNRVLRLKLIIANFKHNSPELQMFEVTIIVQAGV